jgi:hypothetical protein
VQAFTESGVLVAVWEMPHPSGGFFWPYAVGVDGAGNVYVSDPFARDVLKFGRNGNILARWVRGATGDPAPPRQLERRNVETRSLPSGIPVTRAPWFSCPVSIAFAPGRDGYILDQGRSAVIRFQP